MKTDARKPLAMALLAGAPIVGVLLYLSGFQLFSASFEGLSGSGGGGWSGGWVGHVQFHWPCFPVLCVALLGLWLLTPAKHEQPKA